MGIVRFSDIIIRLASDILADPRTARNHPYYHVLEFIGVIYNDLGNSYQIFIRFNQDGGPISLTSAQLDPRIPTQYREEGLPYNLQNERFAEVDRIALPPYIFAINPEEGVIIPTVHEQLRIDRELMEFLLLFEDDRHLHDIKIEDPTSVIEGIWALSQQKPQAKPKLARLIQLAQSIVKRYELDEYGLEVIKLLIQSTVN